MDTEKLIFYIVRGPFLWCNEVEGCVVDIELHNNLGSDGGEQVTE